MTDIKLPKHSKHDFGYEFDSGIAPNVEAYAEAYALEAVRLNATVSDAAEAVNDTNAVLASRYFELLKVVEAYEKHGVTCQTFRHFVDTPCAECNCAPAAPQPAQPLTDQQCDAIYTALDAWARKADAYEFGLPRAYGGGAKGGREIIRNAISGVKND